MNLSESAQAGHPAGLDDGAGLDRLLRRGRQQRALYLSRVAKSLAVRLRAMMSRGTVAGECVEG